MTFKLRSRRKKEFKLGRRTRVERPVFGKAEQLKAEEDIPPFYIRGILAGSKEEYWVSLALTRIEEREGWTWEYQVPIFGGRELAHGLVVDFILHTPGRDTWINPMGRYWHTGKNEDRLEEENAARKKNVKYLAFFTELIPTKQATYIYLKTQLGL